MLDVLTSSSTSTGLASGGHQCGDNTALAPPVILAGSAQDESAFPSAIFGKVPAGFNLEGADIHALGFWLRKAMAIVDNLPRQADPEADNEAVSEAMDPVNRLIKTIKDATPGSAAGVAVQLIAIADFMEWYYGPEDPKGGNRPMEDLEVVEFRSIAGNLDKVLKYDDPTKHVGPLTRGKKLTRAGLLHRYHAFLIGELETLSWNLYGSRDYAMRMRPFDRAVTVRVSNRFVDGEFVERRKSYPFFDDSRLSTRARTVLGSLDIDTERNEDAIERFKGLADAP